MPGAGSVQMPGGSVTRSPLKLMTLAPGHFHAALVQKQMHDGIAPRCYVYAPLDADLVAHVDRIAGFNTRTESPTAWELDIRAGGDYLGRFLREQPGNTVVLSGRNRPKIDLMRVAVNENLHVLADKPWIIDAADLPKLEQLLDDAEMREVLAWDMMTERHEITSRLQRALVRDREIFGDWHTGNPERPALVLESIHHLKKTVAGRPLLRPWWWFDSHISGDALADVGTHLADLALWLIAPDQAVDFDTDIRLLDADRWPLILEPDQFTTLTGLPTFPAELTGRTTGGLLFYAGNNTANFTLRGIQVQLTTRWEYESENGDTHLAVARGTRSTVGVRQPAGTLPEVTITPTDPLDHTRLAAVLLRKCDAWQVEFPGTALEVRDGTFAIHVPADLRTGHEAHFAAVLDEFIRFVHSPRHVPTWERTNLRTKYAITTKSVELARQRRSF